MLDTPELYISTGKDRLGEKTGDMRLSAACKEGRGAGGQKESLGSLWPVGSIHGGGEGTDHSCDTQYRVDASSLLVGKSYL